MTEPTFECEADVVGVSYGLFSGGMSENIWLCRDPRCQVDPDTGPIHCMAKEYYMEHGKRMEIRIYHDPDAPVQTEPLFVTLQRFESMIKPSRRLRLKSWWLRRRQPKNVRALVDLHQQELERRMLFGEQDR